ncbi:MAG: TIGR04190 family B12-binding domain/radical SAM domain protein, partial [Actinomycetota bacterium]|nr:TIGR04190 family B12-binding domain/radical SAM domain protein [Actinomycetota bacterium]
MTAAPAARRRLAGKRLTPLAGSRRIPMSVRDVFTTDLALMHAPSVYDFRTSVIMHGPIADAVPSTNEFEMYPVGLTSIASYLSANHYNVKIINLAYLMLASRDFDVEAYVARLHPKMFGIDLHWLPHAQGALAIAELVKRHHPGTPVLMGGLSASYYHEELAAYPCVDYVLRGDSTEEPCRQLLAALRGDRPLARVENLTWKDSGGAVRVNPLTFIPADLDYVDVPAYSFATKAVFKYASMRKMVPYREWPQYPTTMLLNSRGCPLECSVCGGSASAYAQVAARSAPAFRSPEKLVNDVRVIRGFSNAPIFMVHDPRIGGHERAGRFFDLLRQESAPNEFVFELFSPAGDEFFGMVQASTAAFSLEITIESPDEALRARNAKWAYPNALVESTIASALRHGCGKLDLFFMVGIPGQDVPQALAMVDYCDHLVTRFGADPRLQFYVAPLAPFLDPGSRAFEDPGFGYRKRFSTLEEHRQALLEPSWKQLLSYDSDAMTRDQIVDTTYRVAHGLNELKHARNLIDEPTYQVVDGHLRRAEETLKLIDQALELPPAGRAEALAGIRQRVGEANEASLCAADELKWAGVARLTLRPRTLGRLGLALGAEVGHSWHR